MLSDNKTYTSSNKDREHTQKYGSLQMTFSVYTNRDLVGAPKTHIKNDVLSSFFPSKAPNKC